jgi:hypothetical protein
MAKAQSVDVDDSENIKGAMELMYYYHSKDIPAYLHGPPGVGKSAIPRQMTKKLGIGFKDIRLGSKIPEDISGIPVPDLQQKMAVWLKAEFWPTKERDGDKGIIIFDELSDAPKSLQSCAYQIILDRKINDFELPKGWWPCAAGNRREDRAAAQSLSSALANRFAHIKVSPDPEAFIEWGNANNINPLITGFIRFRPNLLYSMEGADLLSFPTPRAWEQVAKCVEADQSIRFRLVRGLVGDGPAGEFEVYMKGLNLPSIEDIVKDPKRCMIPKEPSSKYALSSMLARFATRANFAAVVTYCSRSEFGRDFETVTALDATKRDSTLCDTKAWIEWANKNNDLHL